MVDVVALFIVLMVQNVSAYYNPSTGRFFSRDPVDEPGFQLVQTGAHAASPVSPAEEARPPRRWINRDSKPGGNWYQFVKNNALSFWNVLGLYVNLVYDVANQTLTATDVDTKKTLTLKKVYSGNGSSCCKKQDQWKTDEGPLPTGKYLVGLGFDSGLAFQTTACAQRKQRPSALAAAPQAAVLDNGRSTHKGVSKQRRPTLRSSVSHNPY